MSPNADQNAAFSAGEGDNWFHRNIASLGTEHFDDHAIRMLFRWSERESVQSVCELGCSNGWRLGAIADLMPSVRQSAGSDPSGAAIEDGRRRWPQLELAVGSLDQPGLTGQFDVVIVSFVLHWVGRDRLSASISAVDALLRDGGALIIADFLPDQPCARHYHHRTDIDIYTYKQDYARCFSGLGIYAELEREVFAHSGRADGPIDPQDRAACVLLRKNLQAYDGL